MVVRMRLNQKSCGMSALQLNITQYAHAYGPSCVLAEVQSCRLGGEAVEVLQVGAAPGLGGGAALLRATAPGGAVVERWVTSGGLVPLRTGRPVSLDEVSDEPAVLLRVRETPGNPWALAAAAVLALGTALMWRRLLPRAGA